MGRLNEKDDKHIEIDLYATNVLMESMFKQIWTVCEFMNDTNGKVATWKYVDYALYSWHKRLKEIVGPECKADLHEPD